MNKTYLIVGGASAASLVVGVTSGYFLAKRKFDATVEDLIAQEVDKTRKHFSILLMEAKSGKPDSPEEVLLSRRKYESDADYQKRLREYKGSVAAEEDDEEPEADDKELLTEADNRAIAKGREALGEAAKAMVNYQGFAAKPDSDEVVENNIFTNSTPKKSLPPRDPETGHFLPRNKKREKEEEPYLITPEEFLQGDMDFEPKNLRYFRNEKTLVDVENGDEPVDNGRVGEVNLTLFPETEEGVPSIICVRNEMLQEDYEIQLMTESLTAYMGLGDEDEDEVGDDSPAEEDEDAESDLHFQH